MTIFTQSRLLSKVLSIFSLLMLLTSNLMAQFCLGLNDRPDDANPDEIFLDLTTEEFIGVASMQFSITFDESVVEPISLETSNLEGFSNGSVNFKPTNLPGMMALAWFDVTTEGVTYSEEAPLLVFKFRKLKEGDPAFDFAELPTVVEVVLCRPGSAFDCDVLDNFLNCNTGESLIPSVNGKLYLDENKNCELDGEESINTLKSWRGWQIGASQDGAYKFTGLAEDGSYSLKIFPGENLIEIIPPGPYYGVCNPSFTINTEDTESNPPFFEGLIQILEECPLLEVNLASVRVEPCEKGFYFLTYANNGTTDIIDAYIDLSMDARIIIEEIDAPSTNLGNNNYKIYIGDLPIGASEFVPIFADIPCDILPEETFRNEAIIFPPNSCGEVSNAWSGASLKVDGRCEGDQIIFEFENVGDADMVEPSQYIVIEDAIIYRTQNIQLARGDKKTVSVNANGSTYFIQAEQEIGHPGTYLPSAFVEACGRNDAGKFSTGFANRFPEENSDLAVSIDYQFLEGSQEPSRLSASPIGFEEEHYIEPNNVIEYTIHFDNTVAGIQIIDELSPLLDVTTFKPVAVNSNYDYTLEEGILTLDVISSPSNTSTNQNDFVKFSIQPKADLPMGTVISNTATLIYSEERTEQTNTVFHTIEENFLQTSTSISSPIAPSSEVTIYPNPSSEVVIFTINDWQPVDYQLSIFDVDGKKLRSHVFNNNQYRFKKGDLPTGTYLYRLIGMNGTVDNGFFVLID